MKYYEIATVTASNPWPWANMLRNMNKCENGWSNFWASFRVVALKLIELIRFTLANQWFFQHLTCRCSLSDLIMSYHFLCVEHASTSSSLYALSATVTLSAGDGNSYQGGVLSLTLALAGASPMKNKLTSLFPQDWCKICLVYIGMQYINCKE